MTQKVCVPSLITVLSVVCLASMAPAQTSWWKTYGGTGQDQGYSVQSTADGGYIVAGSTASFGAGSFDAYLVKTSASGDTLWTRTYGDTSEDGGNSVWQTADSGYIIVGYTGSFGAGGHDVYLIRTDASGDTLWTRTYGGTGGDVGNSVEPTADSGYIVAGYTWSFGAGSADVYLVKANASGDTLWTRAYGGTKDDEGNSVQPTADGGCVIAGFTASFGAGSHDVYLIKTNAFGDTLWTRTYGGTNSDEGSSVQQTADGGYVIAGYTRSYGAGYEDFYLIKTNASGDTLWTRTYGGTNSDEGSSVQQTADGGYIVAGVTHSFGPSVPGHDNVYLVKTNASGDTLWTRTFGGTGDDEGYAVRRTKDGGYIIAGWTNSSGSGSRDVYLIKTDTGGNIGVEEPPARHPARPALFPVRPCPFTAFARIPGHETELFSLADVSGRQVAVCRGDRVGEGLRPGVYFLSPAGPMTGRAVTIIKAAR